MKMIKASTSVNEMAAVGDPTQGNMPIKLQPRMNRKIVQNKGMNFGESCGSIPFSTMSVLMNVKKLSSRFQIFPLGAAPSLALPANQVNKAVR
jgi:hypothetical protein